MGGGTSAPTSPSERRGPLTLPSARCGSFVDTCRQPQARTQKAQADSVDFCSPAWTRTKIPPQSGQLQHLHSLMAWIGSSRCHSPSFLHHECTYVGDLEFAVLPNDPCFVSFTIPHMVQDRRPVQGLRCAVDARRLMHTMMGVQPTMAT
jgi:hypothetical protein